jgi:hypothetical protein
MPNTVGIKKQTQWSKEDLGKEVGGKLQSWSNFSVWPSFSRPLKAHVPFLLPSCGCSPPPGGVQGQKEKKKVMGALCNSEAACPSTVPGADVLG